MLVSYGKMSISQVNAVISQFEALKGAIITKTPAACSVCMLKQDGEKIRMFVALKITGGYLVRAQKGLINTI